MLHQMCVILFFHFTRASILHCFFKSPLGMHFFFFSLSKGIVNRLTILHKYSILPVADYYMKMTLWTSPLPSEVCASLEKDRSLTVSVSWHGRMLESYVYLAQDSHILKTTPEPELFNLVSCQF